MKYLYNHPPYESATRPDLILLDLNVPRKDGREVLVEIKSDPILRRIPVLILSSSTHLFPPMILDSWPFLESISSNDLLFYFENPKKQWQVFLKER